MEIWQLAVAITASGLITVAALCIIFFYYKCCKCTTTNSTENRQSERRDSASALTRMQFLLASRVPSTVDVSSLSLHPRVPSSARSDVENLGAFTFFSGMDEENEEVHSSRYVGEILGTLAGVEVDEEKINSGGEIECSICLQEYERGEIIKWLPCMHCYHEACIGTWFRFSVVCPLCKLPL